jgi:hypothetical protein
MQTITKLNTVYVIAYGNTFRLWYNEAGYWQIDIRRANELTWLYFGCANTQPRALAQIGATL